MPASTSHERAFYEMASERCKNALAVLAEYLAKPDFFIEPFAWMLWYISPRYRRYRRGR